MWIANLNLDEMDKESLLSPIGWLNDNLINAAQKLLSIQFPNVRGLQDVALGNVMGFAMHDSEFIQILHSPPDHWVTVSTIV